MYSSPHKGIAFHDLGTIAYEHAWALQKQLLEHICQLKLSARQQERPAHTPNYLLFCDHPHVYTLGKSGKQEHLLLSREQMQALGITYYPIERGGDITYHGPGQLVGYPVIDLENFMTDLDRYLRGIEEAIIRTLGHFGLQGDRYPGYTGVWLEPDGAQARKIAAIGIKCSRWVAMHGFALNVNTDLSYFGHIIPCGISDKAVTSLQQELGQPVDMELVKNLMKTHMAEVFEWHYVEGENLAVPGIPKVS
ncbi:MAG: lipoyl(octanoyl) transferase LipB [Bacteroidetes bacterium]|nr:lipoyl(octanoyl) transferase LipB [Bacteroidota bacterium]